MMQNDAGVEQYIEWSRLDCSKAGPRCKVLLGDLNSDGQMELLFVQADGDIDDRYVPHQIIALTAYTLDGELLWQVGEPSVDAGGPGSDFPAQIYDWDLDGHNEVLCVMNGELLVLAGHDGSVKRRLILPGKEAHDCMIICNLRGTGQPQDLILKDRYRNLWAMDYDWNLLWTYEGNPGHFPYPYDLDGDGRDEVIAGYDVLDAEGRLKWSTQPLEDHADCIWVGDVLGRGDKQIVIGGSVTVMYDSAGQELWRYEGSIESQHIALGRFIKNEPGLQVAGLDRIVRGDVSGRNSPSGKDGIFMLNRHGEERWKEDRQTSGWLTIIHTIRRWDYTELDYILAFRRGGGINPTIYDGQMNIIAQFPFDGYVVFGDLLQSGLEQVVIYNNEEARVYGKEARPASVVAGAVGRGQATAIPQEKRLYSSTLYPGGEY